MTKVKYYVIGVLTALAVGLAAQSSVLNPASQLTGRWLMTLDYAETVTGLKTFDRGANPPFAVGGSSTKVTTLDADKLDGLDSTAFQLATTGTGSNSQCDVRLTGSSGLPVTLNDVTNVATIYATPFDGNRCAVYDGASVWNTRTFVELPITVPASATACYDVFVYDTGSTIAAETTAWTSCTARTAPGTLVAVNGVWTRTDASTRRYIGSFRTTGASQTSDNLTQRLIYNYQHRFPRELVKLDTTASWNYTTATWRQARATAANIVEYMNGFQDQALLVEVMGSASNTNVGVGMGVASGLDSTTTPDLQFLGVSLSAVANVAIPIRAHTRIAAASNIIGYHYIAWLEYSVATGTTTFYGANNVSLGAAGLRATVYQ